MYDQIRGDILYIMIYTVVTTMALIASCYLMFRDGNAFAADTTPPPRLRRWAVAFFASIALNHAWYMPIFFLTSSNDIKMTDLIGGLLDCMTFFPLAIVLLLTMLQDRRRPLWPVAAMMLPIVAYGLASRSYALLPLVYVYFLLMCLGLVIYMVRALKQYGRWLRDNYADLEHKEVWQSFMVLGITLLVFAIYGFSIEGEVYQYAMQLIIIVLICHLVWRIETLCDLSCHCDPAEAGDAECQNVSDANSILPQTTHDKIGPLLQRHCIDTQLYLQHNLTISQLAKTIGTNRFYLSQHFSRQGTTFNAYINDLRINHFIGLYQEAIASQRIFTAQQLAHESGYNSYSTFSLAFKQRMGHTVTAWMHECGK